MFDECNLNFRSLQATLYKDGMQIARFMEEAFKPFEQLQEMIQTELDKKPEALLPTEEEQIDAQIIELQSKKASLKKVIDR